ncbi:MAG: hypothetical protein QW076_05465, partial [Candidatus Anstonellales archaeon]
RDKKRGVIVTVGLEEHHHPYLARIVLNRMKLKSGGIDNLVRQDAEIGALYGKIISGFFPYVKMSKSIPASSISLGDSLKELHRKIINCGRKNEEVILQMIILASNWDQDRIIEAKNAFENSIKDYKRWLRIKYEYLEFFIKIKTIWEQSRYDKNVDIYQEIFKL